MEKKNNTGRMKLGRVLKSRRFWAGVVIVLVVIISVVFGNYLIKKQKRQQVADQITAECERVESVEVTVLKDARNRKRPTYVVSVPADFSEDERDQIEDIVKEQYGKYYYVIYQ